MGYEDGCGEDISWTEIDRAGYKQIDDPALIRFYAKHNLGEAGPEERAHYLISGFLELGNPDLAQITRASTLHGKPAAMKLLERMAISELDKMHRL